jgi:hypothetical protein
VRTGAAQLVCARITHENSRQGVQPLEQRWVATAIVTRIDELFAIDAEARLPPKGSLRSSVRPGFLGKAVRLIRTSFPWGAFPDESLEMTCADFLAGASRENKNPDILLQSALRFFRFLPGDERQVFPQYVTEKQS